MSNLLWIWGLLITLTSGSLATSHGSSEDPKILILGAGMSGISAAKTLYDAGFQNIEVIEGSSGIGGRLKTSLVSDHTMELGPMWVYGYGTNPVYKLLKDNGISIMEDLPSTWTVRDLSGNDVTETADDAQSRFDDAIDALDIDGKDAVVKNLSDFSMRSRLRYYNWNPRNPVEYAVEDFNIAFEFAVSPDVVSGKYAEIWAPYEAFESDEFATVNDTRGFKHLVEIMADPLMQNADSSPHIVFNEIVKQINQTEEDVVVLTDSGARYHGDYVIITFSMGVLQNRDVVFSPDLPDCKRLAIDKFEIAYLTQIYLEFPSVFWDDTTTFLLAPEQPGKRGIWINMNHIVPGSNILQLSVWAGESKRLELLEDLAIVDELLQQLQVLYPNNVIPTPTNYTVSRYTYDPLFRGAYTYWPTSFTEHNMLDKMAPFGRLLFAGESYDFKQYSYLHSAYTSGIKTANDLIKCFRNAAMCPPTVERPFQCSKEASADDDGDCVSSAGFLSCPLLCIVTLLLFLL